MPLSSVLGASSAIRPGVCTSSTRPAVPYTGQLIFETDTNRLVIYNGSSWVYVADADTPPGLELVKAQTSFTAVSSVTADGVFTSAFTNYLLDINYTTSTTNAVSAKLRLSGTSASTNYTYQQMQGFTTTVSTNAYASQTSMSVGYYGNGTREASSIRIMGPQLAQATQFIVSGGGLGGALVQNIYGQHTTATAYDGIEILTTSGTMTGSYTIYGYRNS